MFPAATTFKLGLLNSSFRIFGMTNCQINESVVLLSLLSIVPSSQVSDRCCFGLQTGTPACFHIQLSIPIVPIGAAAPVPLCPIWLLLQQLPVEPLLLDQLQVGPLLTDLPVFHNQDEISLLHVAKPVRDQENGAVVASFSLVDFLLQLREAKNGASEREEKLERRGEKKGGTTRPGQRESK